MRWSIARRIKSISYAGFGLFNDLFLLISEPAVYGQRPQSSHALPPAKYGGRYTMTLIPGDVIGPELLNHVCSLFRFACVLVDIELVHVNSSATTEDYINNAIIAIQSKGVALSGNMETNHNMPPSHKSRNNLLCLYQRMSGVVECLKIITQSNSLRTAEYAFQLAREKGHQRVTAVHKANIMKLGDGLFLQCCKEEASGYPDIAFQSKIVDNTTMQLRN